MEHHNPAGYREIDHTADWELAVWADSIPELFRQSALGMYALSGMTVGQTARQPQTFALEAGSLESLLVKFLNELLYLGEAQQIAAVEMAVSLSENALTAELAVAPILSQTKEIKAVTYHKLSIRQEGESFRVNIIFDV